MSRSILMDSPAIAILLYSSLGSVPLPVTVERGVRPPFRVVSFSMPVMVPETVTSPPSASSPSSSATTPSGMLKVILAPLAAEAMVRLSAPVPPNAASATSLALMEPEFTTDLPTRYAKSPALIAPWLMTLPDPSLEKVIPSGPPLTAPTAAATSPWTSTTADDPKRMPLGLRMYTAPSENNDPNIEDRLPEVSLFMATPMPWNWTV